MWQLLAQNVYMNVVIYFFIKFQYYGSYDGVHFQNLGFAFALQSEFYRKKMQKFASRLQRNLAVSENILP